MTPWEARLTIDQLRRVAGVVNRYAEDGLIKVALYELELNGMTKEEAVVLTLAIDQGDFNSVGRSLRARR